jgi:hypothetical protein
LPALQLPLVEQPATTRPAAEAIPIAAAAANHDTGALDRERIRAADRGFEGGSNMAVSNPAMPVPERSLEV